MSESSETEAVGHNVIDVFKSEFAQATHDQRRTRRTVSIEVTHDRYVPVRMFREQRNRGLYP